MEKTTIALQTPLREQLDRLAAFEPTRFPVLSLYLDMRPDQQGHENWDVFLRKVFPARGRALKGEARASFERDVERIRAYLERHVPPSVNGLALFACSGANLFEAVQTEAPLDRHWLFIASVPHLYPLARLNDQYRRYAALLLDTNTARLFVFALRRLESRQEVVNTKMHRPSMGGWSQPRYQRHAEDHYLHHIKEVVEVLDRVVREEAIGEIVLACEEVARPFLMQHLPPHLAKRLVDVLSLDVHAPEHEVLTRTLESLRSTDAQTDAARVQALIEAWQADGLAVVGPEDTLQALIMGQVEELLITATPSRLRPATTVPPGVTPGPIDVDVSPPGGEVDPERIKLAGELVAKAQQTSARIRFIEDPALLADVGGVGAMLRFKI